MSQPTPTSRSPRYRSGSYRFAVGVLRPPIRMAAARDWQGTENLPRRGGFIAAGNHVSHIDPVSFSDFLDAHGCPPRFLAKQSLFEAPVIGRVLRGAGQIPVRRESGDAATALAAALDAVHAGECVALYPEATLTRDPGLWPMTGKTGAARIALATGCPVIPIAQWGPQDLLAPYAKRPRPFPRKTIHVWAGPPVDLSAFAGSPATPTILRAATDSILDAITSILCRIRGEPAPAERWDPRLHGQPLTGDPRRSTRGEE